MCLTKFVKFELAEVYGLYVAEILGVKEPLELLPGCRPVPELFRPKEEDISRDRSAALQSMGSGHT